jgi:hypothetical protein
VDPPRGEADVDARGFARRPFFVEPLRWAQDERGQKGAVSAIEWVPHQPSGESQQSTQSGPRHTTQAPMSRPFRVAPKRPHVWSEASKTQRGQGSESSAPSASREGPPGPGLQAPEGAGMSCVGCGAPSRQSRGAGGTRGSAPRDAGIRHGPNVGPGGTQERNQARRSRSIRGSTARKPIRLQGRPKQSVGTAGRSHR